MATAHSFDVIVVGGGIAGSTLAGVLARSGPGVLVVEKEARFGPEVPMPFVPLLGTIRQACASGPATGGLACPARVGLRKPPE